QLAYPLAQPQQVLDHQDEVRAREDPPIQAGVRAELRVELQPADARDVVTPRVLEHALEERLGRLPRGRVARAHPLVDLEQSLLLRVAPLVLAGLVLLPAGG